MTPEYLAEYRRLAKDETDNLQERDLWRNIAILKLADEVESLQAALAKREQQIMLLGEARLDGEAWKWE